MDHDHLSQVPWVAGRPGDVLAAARERLAAPALSALIRRLGGPGIQNFPGDLAAFLEWSRRVLDTRGGVERHEAPTVRFPRDTYSTFLSAGRELGMLAPRPPLLTGYDLTVILGGTVIGNHLRAALAADLAQRGISLGTVVGLTAHRPLTPLELTAVEPHSESSEWENLLREINGALGPATTWAPEIGEILDSYQSALDRDFTLGEGGPMRMLVAPSSETGRRANTSDAVWYLTGKIPPAARTRVLLITSAIYTPYQYFLAAPILLSAGTRHAEIIGTRTSADAGLPLLCQRIAQEIHSAASAAYRLWPGSAE